MGKLYDNYAAALEAGTRCKFQLSFSFPFPPPIPGLTLPTIKLPRLPTIPFWCPLD